MKHAGAIGGGVVVVAIAGAYLGATAWSGRQAEARMHEQLVKAQARFPFVRVRAETFERGFFTSTATTTLTFGCVRADDKDPVTATLSSRIRQAPFAGGAFAAAVVDTDVRVAGGPLRQAALANGAVPLTVHTVVGFKGGARSTFESPAAQVSFGDGGSIAWQGFVGTLDSAPDGRFATYQLTSPGFTVSDPAAHASARVAGLSLQGDGKALDDSGLVTIGKVRGRLDSVAIEPAGGSAPGFALNGLQFASETSLEGDLLGAVATFSGSGAFGETRIDGFETQVSMKRVHAPSYRRLMELSSQYAYGCDAQDPMARMMALQQKMNGDLVALLGHAPEISLDRMTVRSGGKTAELAYSFGIDGVSDADAAMPMPMLFLSHGKLKASGRVPVEWLHRLSEAGAPRGLQGRVPDPSTVDVMLARAEAQGYLVRDGADVKASAEFANGVMTVNGKVLAPPRR